MPEQLPAHVQHALSKALKDGVSYSRDRATGKVTAIHWRPGDRNALAEAIIEKVTSPKSLVLDGRHFIITPVHGHIPGEPQ